MTKTLKFSSTCFTYCKNSKRTCRHKGYFKCNFKHSISYLYRDLQIIHAVHRASIPQIILKGYDDNLRYPVEIE